MHFETNKSLMESDIMSPVNNVQAEYHKNYFNKIY